jgi:hypothetical protein
MLFAAWFRNCVTIVALPFRAGNLFRQSTRSEKFSPRTVHCLAFGGTLPQESGQV